MSQSENSIPPTGIEGWKIYLVDAHSLIFQVFHALPEMTSPRGEQVGAVYGFTRDILYLIEEKDPDVIACAFDLSGPTFRHEFYDAYKADRDEMPDELAPQIPKIQQILAALSVPILTSPGYEADDILATLARQCDHERAECYLVTGDKDCRQLITDHVSVYNIRKDEVFDTRALQAEWGIRPDQVVDFQALVGDKVDNVPGVPLIGPKIARELLGEYGTLEAVLDNADKVKGAKRSKNLIDYREQALVSRRLAKLSDKAPVTLDWKASRVDRVDQEGLAELSAQFGFRSLAERLTKLTSSTAVEIWDADYRLVDTPAKLREFLGEFARQDSVSMDTETTHLYPRWAEIVGFSFAWQPGAAYYLPVRGPAGESKLDLAETLRLLKPLLEDPAIGKIGQNLKYDLVVLRNVGVHVAGVQFDTMVASYLLDAGQRNHNLDDLSQRYLGHTTIKIDELLGRGKQQKRMDEVAISAVAPYAAEDADVPLRLWPLLAARLAETDLDRLNNSLEVPLIDVLAELEFNGVRVDAQRLAELSARYSERLEKLEAEIEELAGRALNIASPKQLRTVLFDELKLPVVKKIKTGPSTDASVLEELAAHHPLPAKIIEHRQYAKLKNTYVDTLPMLIHQQTQRVHASFNQVVAATGRLSSSDPNLQNIPVRTAEGRDIRSAFIAGQEGWKLLAADYSQIELRVLAHFSEDEALCAAFANDEDIHSLVASQVFGIPLEEVSGAMRRSAKAVNFGVIYGQSPFGLAKSLGIAQEEAARFIDGYFATYGGVERFINQTLIDCRRQGYVQTLLGRRRAIQGVRPVPAQANFLQTSGHRQLNLPERTAVNSVIQGSAADLIKLAMLAIHGRLKEEKLAARMLLQIHDELVFEVPVEEVDSLAELVRHEMMHVLSLRVPLKTDIKWGDNWAECDPWDG